MRNANDNVAQPWEWFEYPEECEEPDPAVWRRLDLKGETWLAVVKPPNGQHEKWRWRAGMQTGECESERLAKQEADTALAQLVIRFPHRFTTLGQAE